MGNKVNNILNESDYRNAQAYVKQAQEIFAKYLKSPEAANKYASSDIQPHLNTTLSHLKMTNDSKGSLSSVMNLIYLQLYPRLIANYNISWCNNDNILYHILEIPYIFLNGLGFDNCKTSITLVLGS